MYLEFPTKFEVKYNYISGRSVLSIDSVITFSWLAALSSYCDVICHAGIPLNFFV